MKVLETDWWAIALPPEWWGEAEDDSVLIGDNDELGCIEISTLHKEQGEFELDELYALATDQSATDLGWRQVELGDFQGWTSASVEEDTAIREWYLGNAALMLYVTYSCAEENGGMDDAAVDELLDSLSVAH